MRTPIIVLSALLSFVAAPALADGPFRSKTTLTAAQEVQDPPVVSDGRARAVVTFDKGFTRARVHVRFRNLVGNDVTRLHFHCNVAGENGPIAIGLIDFVAPANDNSDDITLDGYRIFGTLENDDFPAVDPCPGTVGLPVNNVVSLAAAIDAGLIYWNLHTDAFPAGELRGQVRPLEQRKPSKRFDRDDFEIDDDREEKDED